MKTFFKRITPSLLFLVSSFEFIHFLDRPTSNLLSSSGNLSSKNATGILSPNNQTLNPTQSSTTASEASTSVTSRNEALPTSSPAGSSITTAISEDYNSGDQEGEEENDDGRIVGTTPKSSQTVNKKTNTAITIPSPTPKTSPTPKVPPTPKASPTPTPIQTKIPSVQTIKGDPISYRYGVLQLQITVENKKINNITVLKAPSGRNAEFTNYAVPILISQALKNQTAFIDGASGATYTSQAFVDSLQSAINRIKI